MIHVKIGPESSTWVQHIIHSTKLCSCLTLFCSKLQQVCWQLLQANAMLYQGGVRHLPGFMYDAGCQQSIVLTKLASVSWMFHHMPDKGNGVGRTFDFLKSYCAYILVSSNWYSSVYGGPVLFCVFKSYCACDFVFSFHTVPTDDFMSPVALVPSFSMDVTNSAHSYNDEGGL